MLFVELAGEQGKDRSLDFLVADSLSISLYIDNQEAGGWARRMATTFPVADGQSTVAVHVLPEGASIGMWKPSVEELHSVGINDPALIRASGEGAASYVLADLLGYEADDIRFDDRNNPFAA